MPFLSRGGVTILQLWFSTQLCSRLELVATLMELQVTFVSMVQSLYILYFQKEYVELHGPNNLVYLLTAYRNYLVLTVDGTRSPKE